MFYFYTKKGINSEKVIKSSIIWLEKGKSSGTVKALIIGGFFLNSLFIVP